LIVGPFPFPRSVCRGSSGWLEGIGAGFEHGLEVETGGREESRHAVELGTGGAENCFGLRERFRSSGEQVADFGKSGEFHTLKLNG